MVHDYGILRQGEQAPRVFDWLVWLVHVFVTCVRCLTRRYRWLR